MLTVTKVNALPVPLQPNTLYLVPDGADGLVVTVTGTDAAVVKSTKTSQQIADAIAAAAQTAADNLAIAVQNLNEAIDQAEADAKSYADGLASALGQSISDETAARQQGDTDTLNAAKLYTDTAIGNLDMSSTALYVADITARNALSGSLTKSSFVVVGDASGDPTVDAGSALYFFHFGEEEAWTKLAEYESMDLTFPNLDILSDLSDVGGQLYYKGAAVATVHNTVNQW